MRDFNVKGFGLIEVKQARQDQVRPAQYQMEIPDFKSDPDVYGTRNIWDWFLDASIDLHQELNFDR